LKCIEERTMSSVPFEGYLYNDDRMFVMALARGEVRKDPDGTVTTTVLHDEEAQDAVWCLATYRNVPGYPAFRIDRFESRDAAQAYLEKVEPTVPLVSRGGQPRDPPLPYAEFVAWKQANGFTEYPIDELYTRGNRSREEIFVQRRSDNTRES
jgi:hypothetical protein